MSRPATAKLVAAFAAVYVFWGGTFLAIRYAVADIPPLLMIGVRCAGGAAVLAAWLAWRGELTRGTRAQWLTAFVAGAFLFLGCHAVAAWAEQRVSSGQTALLMTATPLWTVLLSSVLSRTRPRGRVLLGLAVGVIGVGTLAAGGPAWSDAGVQRLAIVGGGLSWAIGSIVARDGARPGSAAQSTAMQLAAGAVVVLVASAASGEPGAWHSAHLSVRGVASLGYLIICGTVLGFGAFTWLMRVTTAAMAGSSAFVNPVVALVLGWAVGDDTLSGRTLAAAVLVVAAVLLTWESPRAERRLPTGRAPTRAGGMQVDAAA